MFLPDSCDIKFKLPLSNDKINWISGNRERTIVVIATNSTLYFYGTNQQLLLCVLNRLPEDVENKGTFKKVCWRHNSKSLCTSLNYVYIYSVETTEDENCFNLHDTYTESYRTSSEFFIKQKIPIINVYLSVIAKLETEAQCVVSLKDELFICLSDGWIHRLGWSGDIFKDLSFNVCQIPFSTDQILAKSKKISESSFYVIDFVYCPLIGGLCAVFNDGRAALLVSNTPQFNPKDVSAVWAVQLYDAVCCAANHKFRLIYFGCKNGDVAAYSLNNLNGSLIQTFRINLSIKNGREFLPKIGRVLQIQCLIQGFVFAVIWEIKDTENNKDVTTNNGIKNVNNFPIAVNCPSALAIFSPFGAQWWSSVENTMQCVPSYSYTCMDWGPDGYQLWLGTWGKGLFCINFVRSMPDFTERAIMIGSDKIYLSPLKLHDAQAIAPHFVWDVFKVPCDYMSINWPLKYVGIDDKCNSILVAAGVKGFCFCTIKNKKWRLFRKEIQEQDLCLTADIVVYKEFILVAVSNQLNEFERLCAFNTSEQLDLDYAAISMPVNKILCMNSRQDYLLTFDFTSTVSICLLKQSSYFDAIEKKQKHNLEIECLAGIRISELLPHPSCVVSIQLAQLNYYSEFCPGFDSLLLNVSGQLMLLSPYHRHSMNKTSINYEFDNSFQLHTPTLIASNVERFWTHPTCCEIPYLNKALWINMGYRKMQIWLPLSNDLLNKTKIIENKIENLHKNFISKRIMLSIKLNLYPLALDENCLAYGVESFFTMFTKFNNVKKNSESNPIIEENELEISLDKSVKCVTALRFAKFPTVLTHSLARITEVFIHHLLKELLKRNLGSYALPMASACRSLPYFSHILELLLHDVLEEEATFSEPIPDPLLPTVISFISEFPEYLQIIVHCARKTELAFWNLLFSVSQHPRELFRMCMTEGDLDTATCCLILLQNMEPISVSNQFATTLLEEALIKRRWALARDIVRFMQLIDYTDFKNNPDSPSLMLKLAYQSSTTKKCSILPTDSVSDDDLLFNKSSNTNKIILPFSPGVTSKTVENKTVNNLNFAKNDLSVFSHHTSQIANQNCDNNLKFSPTNSSTSTIVLQPLKLTKSGEMLDEKLDLDVKIDKILEKHGLFLLDDYALRDFAAFASHINLNVKNFFSNSLNMFKVPSKNFPLVLMKLHAQFSWPYPIAAKNDTFFISKSFSLLRPFKDEKNIKNDSTTSILNLKSSNSLITLHDSVSTNQSDNYNSTEDTISLRDEIMTNSANSLKTVEDNFNWKVFEELCKHSKTKGTKQSEMELQFILDLLSDTDAIEWIYFLCILKQDAKKFNENILSILKNNRCERWKIFLDNVKEGTNHIYKWAETKCPAYAPIINLFNEFLHL